MNFFSLFISMLFFSSPLLSISPPWSSQYEDQLVLAVANKSVLLDDFSSFRYPHASAKEIVSHFPSGKVPIFGYGSLLNIDSASRSLSPEILQTMEPAVAFGLKRLFTYHAEKTSHWGSDQNSLEKAMLNVAYANNYEKMINGAIIEVGEADLASLIQREVGYDLVPILVANWDDALAENPHIAIKIAYTFLSPYEVREGKVYASYCYYPVRGYLHASQQGAMRFGQEFFDFWNQTTYLGDGVTPIQSWQEDNFADICRVPF